jgi:hypothetical protein
MTVSMRSSCADAAIGRSIAKIIISFICFISICFLLLQIPICRMAPVQPNLQIRLNEVSDITI